MTATLVGQNESLLATVKRLKLELFEHVSRYASMFKTVVQACGSGNTRLESPSKPSVEKLARQSKRMGVPPYS
ncbi:hypothetical protein DPMN_033520 [Dreissena polymorpha]|uniref:Uncharacterized protein n=1 Tax=Dreissena polymorpha TaxID=45954 RepID=A0A9D4M4Z8_DREPO|nr:hypothetical protein DPMN_033520 [Dreissena polymorpha]